jgi:hypothetical protein
MTFPPACTFESSQLSAAGSAAACARSVREETSVEATPHWIGRPRAASSRPCRPLVCWYQIDHHQHTAAGSPWAVPQPPRRGATTPRGRSSDMGEPAPRQAGSSLSSLLCSGGRLSPALVVTDARRQSRAGPAAARCGWRVPRDSGRPRRRDTTDGERTSAPATTHDQGKREWRHPNQPVGRSRSAPCVLGDSSVSSAQASLLSVPRRPRRGRRADARNRFAHVKERKHASARQSRSTGALAGRAAQALCSMRKRARM